MAATVQVNFKQVGELLGSTLGGTPPTGPAAATAGSEKKKKLDTNNLGKIVGGVQNYIPATWCIS